MLTLPRSLIFTWQLGNVKPRTHTSNPFGATEAMAFDKHYNPLDTEDRLTHHWAESQVYKFDGAGSDPIYAIDTPPPTVSGSLHLGHIFSYTQLDAIARYRRMNGYEVFFPMGFDDNGLPTEKFAERLLGTSITSGTVTQPASEIRQAALTAEADFERLWKRVGLSVDWELKYSTISDHSQRISQASFLDLHKKNLVYRSRSPSLWCYTCNTAVAQAEIDDQERPSVMYTLPFLSDHQDELLIGTTRPELLAACVAVLVNPLDPRYKTFIGRRITVPYYDLKVPVIASDEAEIDKGTGAVMVCTFGDTSDIRWWRTHELPLRELLAPDGTMLAAAGPLSGMHITRARGRILDVLRDRGLVRGSDNIAQVTGVHERCKTPIEYLMTHQWFVRILDNRGLILNAARSVRWHPGYMFERFRDWVENLAWDWSISRHRTYGVPFPVWYCNSCGQTILAKEEELPVDPRSSLSAPIECPCGSAELSPESDVMDTWATSALTPEIALRGTRDPLLFDRAFPMELRPQAHDIIRTWAFYTITKSVYHQGKPPWTDIMISGHALAPTGDKLSKSQGNSFVDPYAAIQQWSADAVRYWACKGSLGSDVAVSDEVFRAGRRLVMKLWSVARFIAPHVDEGVQDIEVQSTYIIDRWVLSRVSSLIDATTTAYESFQVSSALALTEQFFWRVFADNYLEMVKGRLYGDQVAARRSAVAVLRRSLYVTLRLLAPITPFVCEAIYEETFRQRGRLSIHNSSWPTPEPEWPDPDADRLGEIAVKIATTVRKYKSENRLALGAPLSMIDVYSSPSLVAALPDMATDLRSVTRTSVINGHIKDNLDDSVELVIHG